MFLANGRTVRRIVLGISAISSAACASADGAEQAEDGTRNGGALNVSMPVESEGVEAAPLADTALARLVAEIQPGVEHSAGITAEAPLNVAATDEARLRAYLESQIIEQLSAEEADAITATYARLGMIPDTLDLRGLFIALLEEQVVGYYDPRTDTLFVHERVSADQLAPVLAHELVHALQDQQVALDEVTQRLSDRNDASTAAQAAIEGHATFAMMEYMFGGGAPGGADLTGIDLEPLFANIDLSQFGDFGPAEVLAAAPPVVREGLIFPYIGGLLFVHRLWRDDPERPLPFGDRLPESTEQVLHIERWLAGDRPTVVEFLEDVEGWEVVYAKDLGELETRIFLEGHLGSTATAAAAAGGWDGDAYRLLRRGQDEAFVWVSVWDSDADADEFEAAVAEAYARRYIEGDREPDIARATIAERAVVRVLDVPPGVTLPSSATAFGLRGGDDVGR
ncbi:MAG: hypothetical protein MJB57_01295 [Gemmatimonadetes bacterium]|nr:hypothetical protein [Gemmatimonadota bacterium]